MSVAEGDVRLMLGDCLEMMAEIADGTVNLIAADLPYGVTSCRWDVVIPFEPLWAHYRRVLKPRGAVVLTASQPFTTDIIQSNRGWFKYTLVAEKTKATGFFNAPFQPLRAHEDIAVFSPAASTFSPGPKMTFNPQLEEGNPYTDRRTKRKPVPFAFHSYPPEKQPKFDKTTRNPRSVIRFSCDQGLHNTQKSLDLFEYLIRTYSDPGDLILDNAAGSGTTLIAAINTERRAIGIEKDPAIYATAQARIQQEIDKHLLFAG